MILDTRVFIYVRLEKKKIEKLNLCFVKKIIVNNFANWERCGPWIKDKDHRDQNRVGLKPNMKETQEEQAGSFTHKPSSDLDGSDHLLLLKNWKSSTIPSYNQSMKEMYLCLYYETTHMAGLLVWPFVYWCGHCCFFSHPAKWAFHWLNKK